MTEEVKVNKEIEEMLNALGDPTPEGIKEDEEEEEVTETEEEKAERERKEAEEAELSEEEKAAKKKEEEEAEAAEAERLVEEEKRKGETEKQKKEREDAEAVEEEKRQAANKAAAETKEKEALAKIESEKKDREKAEEDARKAKEEKRKKADEPLKLDETDFIGDLDPEDLVRDKVAFNKLLNAVYAKGVNDSKRIATEGVLNSIPDIVKHNLTLLTTLKEASDNFYKENKDLAPFKKVVAAVFEEIASANPDKKYSELMNLVGPEARKRLELHKKATKKKDDKEDENDKNGKPPRLPGKVGSQRQTPSRKPNTSPLEDEISEMNKSLGR